jgi:hypothetical protein
MASNATDELSDDALERELTALLERAAGGPGLVLSVKLLAQATNSSPSFWNKQRLQPNGAPVVRVGRSVCYVPAAVAKWLVARRRRGEAPRAA